MRIKSERDFWSGLLFIVIGVGFAWGAMNYSMGPPCNPSDPCASSLLARFSQLSARPGAGFFPLGLAVILAILGAVIAFKSLTIESPNGDPIGSIAWRPLAVVIAAIVAFGVLLEPMGLLITVPIVIFIVSLAGGEFRWLGVTVSAVVLTLFSWAVFTQGLKLTISVWPKFMG